MKYKFLINIGYNPDLAIYPVYWHEYENIADYMKEYQLCIGDINDMIKDGAIKLLSVTEQNNKGE